MVKQMERETPERGKMQIKVKHIPSNFIARIGYNGKEFFVLSWKKLIKKES